MKKIILISNMYPSPSDKSYGVFVKNFKDSIQNVSDDFSFDICVIRGRTTNWPLKIFKYIKFYSCIIYKVLFSDYDLVYNHQVTHSSIPLLFCSFFRQFKLAMNIHGSDLLHTKKISVMLWRFTLPLIKKADVIVVPSSYFSDVLHSKVKDLSEDKIFVSPSGGINTLIFHPFNKTLRNAIIYVSRIDEGKGWDTFLHAIAKLYAIDKLNGKIVYVVGKGGQELELRTLIKKLGLQKICTYLGAKSQPEISELYGHSEIMVFPTRLKESLGLVGIEAMACGVPVIGSNFGCLPEYIIPNKTGFLFKVGDSSDLANKIEQYYALSENEKKSMIRNAITMSSQYESRVIAQRMAAMLNAKF